MARAPSNHGHVHAKPSIEATARQPAKWWQWLLLYPTLAVALLTAAPQWYDRAQAVAHQTRGGSFIDAQKQNDLWRKNLTCAAAPFSWYSNPNNVKIDATICDSGDIFIRASTPQRGQYFRWVPVDDVINARGPLENPLISSASAAEITARVTKVQYSAVVICQKFIDQRHLLRHVRTDSGCFDEVVDTYNGVVVSRTAVPCRSTC